MSFLSTTLGPGLWNTSAIYERTKGSLSQVIQMVTKIGLDRIGTSEIFDKLKLQEHLKLAVVLLFRKLAI